MQTDWYVRVHTINGSANHTCTVRNTTSDFALNKHLCTYNLMYCNSHANICNCWSAILSPTVALHTNDDIYCVFQEVITGYQNCIHIPCSIQTFQQLSKWWYGILHTTCIYHAYTGERNCANLSQLVAALHTHHLCLLRKLVDFLHMCALRSALQPHQGEFDEKLWRDWYDRKAVLDWKLWLPNSHI